MVCNNHGIDCNYVTLFISLTLTFVKVLIYTCVNASRLALKSELGVSTRSEIYADLPCSNVDTEYKKLKLLIF